VCFVSSDFYSSDFYLFSAIIGTTVVCSCTSVMYICYCQAGSLQLPVGCTICLIAACLVRCGVLLLLLAPPLWHTSKAPLVPTGAHCGRRDSLSDLAVSRQPERQPLLT
jgi:hypothetical protein